ncbi:hypothetical protein N5C36_19345 [Shewanella xiamenensis]|uniref:hypothetical protein n=1 Tax=Shewanella xiamenensis TaxID=332186 RepID=UPI00244C8EB5|nr:hypothetical protein [Shewanella xiamenensis]MDH1316228.1 hypothetical protein [Shewanella xiamenensis]
MTFVRAIGHQWLKAQLAHRLQLSLAPCEQIQILCNGKTSLGAVANIMAAIIFIEGKPNWLNFDDNAAEQPLSVQLVLHCFFECSRLLFIRALERQSLEQAEQLVFTLADEWRRQSCHWDVDDETESMCLLMDRLSTQLMKLHLEQRQLTRNMGL